jgi:hypothetical protein
MPLCPICNVSHLQRIFDAQSQTSGWRCSDQLCMYNFDDQKCPKCGAEPVKAERPMLGLYYVYCGQQHKWSVTGDGKVTLC